MDFKKINSDKYNDYYIISDETKIKFYSDWKDNLEPSYHFMFSVDKSVLKDAIDDFDVAGFIISAIKG